MVVVDLGFGDAGKGTITDYWVRTTDADVVVRFNGGAQAGHNVVTKDGRHHTFAQFGSGTFVPTVRTHLSSYTVVHPTALLVEARRLEDIGVRNVLRRITIHREALVTTPFHQAANRLRELARGNQPHGTCGVGVGETMSDAMAGRDDVIRMGDLDDPWKTKTKLQRLQTRKRAEMDEALRALSGLAAAEYERQILEKKDIVDAWLDALAPLRALRCTVGSEEERALLRHARAVVFEGAQGVLLDEWRGFHPHTTWSTCTFDNALNILKDIGWEGTITRIGVSRTYATRHGAGPFPTEDPALQGLLPEVHNGSDGWQGTFRVGYLDGVLLRYALKACGGADVLALTHMDRVPMPGKWKVCRGYRVQKEHRTFFQTALAEPEYATDIQLGPYRDLEYQERLGKALRRVVPDFEELETGTDGENIVRWVEECTGVRVGIVSRGPTAEDKQIRNGRSTRPG